MQDKLIEAVAKVIAKRMGRVSWQAMSVADKSSYYSAAYDAIAVVRAHDAGTDGAAQITAERQRQIAIEGWTPQHDDEHGQGQIADAARAYIVAGLRSERGDVHPTAPPPPWPWMAIWWKPSDDPVRNLVKAGALIAAEIDRLQRKEHRSSHAAESAPQLDAEDPAEPVEDVVSRMCELMGGCACEHCIKRTTAALAVAREGYWSQQDVEKAIREMLPHWEAPAIDAFIDTLHKTLAPKPSLAERVTIVKVEKSAELPGDPYQPWGWDVRRDGLSVFTTHNKIDAERYAAGLRAELAALEADNGGI